MVWWTPKMETEEDCRIYDKFDVQEDIIFQTVNVMFNFGEIVDDAYDIRELLKSGVNIFNIDRTKLDNLSYQIIKKSIVDCSKLPETYSEQFYRSVSLAITMSVKKPVEIEKEVDFIILKDVSTEQNVIDFKESNNHSNLPILIWISKLDIEHGIIDLIQVSNGIILDHSSISDEYSYDVIQLCKKNKKPLFCLKPEVWEDNTTYKGSKRKLVVVASEIVSSGVDGIVFNGCENIISLQTEIIRNIVEAMQVAEDGLDSSNEIEKIRKQIKTPQMSPLTVAIAASLSALKSGAAAIIVLTSTGKTAQLVSHSGAPCPILAITKNVTAAKQMHLHRKVVPLLYEGARVSNWQEECGKRVLFGTEFAAKTGLCGDGAKLVVLAPSVEGVGYCDGFQIVTLPFRCKE